MGRSVGEGCGVAGADDEALGAASLGGRTGCLLAGDTVRGGRVAGSDDAARVRGVNAGVGDVGVAVESSMDAEGEGSDTDEGVAAGVGREIDADADAEGDSEGVGSPAVREGAMGRGWVSTGRVEAIASALSVTAAAPIRAKPAALHSRFDPNLRIVD